MYSEVGKPGSVGPEPFTVFGAPFKKRTQNYEYKIGYEIEYLWRVMERNNDTKIKIKKKITTN